MATDVVVKQERQGPPPAKIVNDFTIQVATVNGSGSQSANMVLLRGIFQMGIPVSGIWPGALRGILRYPAHFDPGALHVWQRR